MPQTIFMPSPSGSGSSSTPTPTPSTKTMKGFESSSRAVNKYMLAVDAISTAYL